MTAEQRPDWVSQRAVAWVLDDAPVPAELLGTLIAIARRCDENGCGSYQSKPTLAAKTGKSKDQVDSDVKRLLDLGLIRLGDQSLPARHGVRPGQRPTVYDVALELVGPKPTRTSKNASGRRKPSPPAATPGMEATPGLDATPGMEAPGRGGMDAPGRGGIHAPQTTLGTTQGTTPLSHRPYVTTERETNASAILQPSIARQVLVAAGADPLEADRLAPVIEKVSSVRTPAAWWRAVAAAGDGPAVLAAGRKALADPDAGRRPSGPGRFQPFRDEISDDDYAAYVGGHHREREPAA